MVEPLLAKSWKTGESPIPTLSWHTDWVMKAADRLLLLRAGSALRAVGLSLDYQPLLERIVRFAVWWHDLGKCMEHFQRMLRRTGEQPFRHEAVSWFLMMTEPWSAFLAAHLPDSVERWMVAACLAGHHRKFYGDDGVFRDPLGASTLLLDHPDIDAWLLLVPGGLKTAKPKLAPLLLKAATLKNAIEELALALEEGAPDLNANQRLIISLAKSFVIASDMAGSALPREKSGPEWIDLALSDRATQQERLTLLDKKVAGRPLRDFQEAAANSCSQWTFIKAGCGTGKTAAACAWGARQHTGRQLWLTYPTTGTATEGYRDYVLDAEIEGALLHSRATLDLEMLHVPDDPEDESQVREQALRGWAADTVVATVDTLLGIVHNQRSGHYAYPGICDSALVFDELHSYDDRLFGCLLRFLEAHPGLPCLFMTASLPVGRFQALAGLCEKLHGKPMLVISGPEELETLPRYRQISDEPMPMVAKFLAAGKKVLWVSNTVKRATQVADDEEINGWHPLRYHSRYRYLDRLARHSAVIHAFSVEGPALACTTQVAEMSLDLSSDLLVMDLAPIPAMIQRLGRLNRRAIANSPVCPFIVLAPDDSLPYTGQELEEAKVWLEGLGAEPVSQADLLAKWNQVETPITRASSHWLDEPLWTRAGSIREASPSVSVLLEEDYRQVQRRECAACACLISMPVKPGVSKRLQRKGHFLLAGPDLIKYDSLRGAEWR